MTEPQVWTIIGVLGGTVVGMVTFGFSMLFRVLRAEFGRMGEKFGRMDEKFGRVDEKFERVIERLDRLDGDVNALMKREFGIDRG